MQDKIRYELTPALTLALSQRERGLKGIMAGRKIPAAWVERVLLNPERTEPDKVDPELRHALGGITEHDKHKQGSGLTFDMDINGKA
ncbi:MAG: hypothetical protein Q8L89_00505 [Gammaproteobacteria bacterium]|nr:hypothetical protein [Gammaproteobacteria bacterium]